MDVCRRQSGVFAGARHQRAGYRLPLRPRPCDSCRHHGRKWNGSQKRRPFQNLRSAGKCRKGADHCAGQDRDDYCRKAAGNRYDSGGRSDRRKTSGKRLCAGKKIGAPAGKGNCGGSSGKKTDRSGSDGFRGSGWPRVNRMPAGTSPLWRIGEVYFRADRDSRNHPGKGTGSGRAGKDTSVF